MRLTRALLPLALASVIASIAPASAQLGTTDLQDRLLSVARAYRDWYRVDDRMRWAPFDCRLPLPSRARVSEGSADLHGRKIYFVYARDREAYLRSTRDDASVPIGQVVVKEAFLPEEVPEPPGYEGRMSRDGLAGDFVVARDGEHRYAPGAFAGLYVMTYLGPRAAGTDAGWAYGTIAASGEITSQGRLASCMGCHARAPHGRLFGLDG